MKRVRNEPLPDILSSPLDSVASGYSTANYAPGFCSFKLQLFQQCLHTPSEGWHNQMLGMLYSVEDQNRATAVTYPEGTGRIDGRAVRLGGMGGLKVAYNPEDRQTYFQFEPKGGFWSTLTQSTPDAVGICDWKPWTRDETGCDEGHQNDHPRVSSEISRMKSLGPDTKSVFPNAQDSGHARVGTEHAGWGKPGYGNELVLQSVNSTSSVVQTNEMYTVVEVEGS